MGRSRSPFQKNWGPSAEEPREDHQYEALRGRTLLLEIEGLKHLLQKEVLCQDEDFPLQQEERWGRWTAATNLFHLTLFVWHKFLKKCIKLKQINRWIKIDKTVSFLRVCYLCMSPVTSKFRLLLCWKKKKKLKHLLAQLFYNWDWLTNYITAEQLLDSFVAPLWLKHALLNLLTVNCAFCCYQI